MRAYILLTERRHLISVYQVHVLFFLFISPEFIISITILTKVSNTGENMCTNILDYNLISQH